MVVLQLTGSLSVLESKYWNSASSGGKKCLLSPLDGASALRVLSFLVYS